MIITYTNTVDDLVAFNMHFVKNSKGFQKKLRRVLLGWSGFFLLMSAFLSIYNQEVAFVIGGVAGVIFMLIFGKLNTYRHVRKLARKPLEPEVNKRFICEHELEITETELIERIYIGGETVTLGSIEQICSVDGYTFIYVSPAAAHVIPSERITSGDYHAFVNELRAKCPQLAGK